MTEDKTTAERCMNLACRLHAYASILYQELASEKEECEDMEYTEESDSVIEGLTRSIDDVIVASEHIAIVAHLLAGVCRREKEHMKDDA